MASRSFRLRIHSRLAALDALRLRHRALRSATPASTKPDDCTYSPSYLLGNLLDDPRIRPEPRRAVRRPN
ncbi:hypothetical protein [Lysobacter gummosus]|uniref:hypothetical protein n=1 Tax=Lysobacter gummosus TaxID=262324 RepID=UPI0036457C46